MRTPQELLKLLAGKGQLWFNTTRPMSELDLRLLLVNQNLPHIQTLIDIMVDGNEANEENFLVVLAYFFGDRAQEFTPQQRLELSKIEFIFQGAVTKIERPGKEVVGAMFVEGVGLYSRIHEEAKEIRETSSIRVTLRSLYALLISQVFFHEITVENRTTDPSQTYNGAFVQESLKGGLGIEIGQLLLFRLSNASQLGECVKINLALQDTDASQTEALLAMKDLFKTITIPPINIELGDVVKNAIGNNNYKGEVIKETEQRVQALIKLGYNTDYGAGVIVQLDLSHIQAKLRALDFEEIVLQRICDVRNMPVMPKAVDSSNDMLMLPTELAKLITINTSHEFKNQLRITLSKNMTKETQQLILALLAAVLHQAEIKVKKEQISAAAQLPTSCDKLKPLALFEVDLAQPYRLRPLLYDLEPAIGDNDFIRMLLDAIQHNRPLSRYQHLMRVYVNSVQLNNQGETITLMLPNFCAEYISQLSALKVPESVAEKEPKELCMMSPHLMSSFSIGSDSESSLTEQSIVQLTLPSWPLSASAQLDKQLITVPVVVPDYTQQIAAVPIFNNDKQDLKSGSIVFVRKVVQYDYSSIEDPLEIEIKRLWEGLETKITLPTTAIITSGSNCEHASDCEVAIKLYGSHWQYESGLIYIVDEDAQPGDHECYKRAVGSDALIGKTEPEEIERIREKMRQQGGRPKTVADMRDKLIENNARLLNKIPRDMHTKNLYCYFIQWLQKQDALIYQLLSLKDATLLTEDKAADKEASVVNMLTVSLVFEFDQRREELIGHTLQSIHNKYLDDFLCADFSRLTKLERSVLCKQLHVYGEKMLTQAVEKKVSVAGLVFSTVKAYSERNKDKAHFKSRNMLAHLEKGELPIQSSSECLIAVSFKNLKGIYVNCRITHEFFDARGIRKAIKIAHFFDRTSEMFAQEQSDDDHESGIRKPKLFYFGYYEKQGKTFITTSLSELLCRVLPYEFEEALNSVSQSMLEKKVALTLYKKYSEFKSECKTEDWLVQAAKWLALIDEVSFECVKAFIQKATKPTHPFYSAAEALIPYYQTEVSISEKLLVSKRVLAAVGSGDFVTKMPLERSLLRALTEIRPNGVKLQMTKLIEFIIATLVKQSKLTLQQAKERVLKLRTFAQMQQFAQALAYQKQYLSAAGSPSSLPANSLVPPHYLKFGPMCKLQQLNESECQVLLRDIDIFIRCILPKDMQFSLDSLKVLFLGNIFLLSNAQTDELKQLLLHLVKEGYLECSSDRYKRLITKAEQERNVAPSSYAFFQMEWVGNLDAYFNHRWRNSIDSLESIVKIMTLDNDNIGDLIIDKGYYYEKFYQTKAYHNEQSNDKSDQPMKFQAMNLLSSDEVEKQVTQFWQASHAEKLEVLCKSLSQLHTDYKNSVINRLRAFPDELFEKDCFSEIGKDTYKIMIKQLITFLEKQGDFSYKDLISSERIHSYAHCCWENKVVFPSNHMDLIKANSPLDWLMSPLSILMFVFQRCMPKVTDLQSNCLWLNMQHAHTQIIWQKRQLFLDTFGSQERGYKILSQCTMAFLVPSELFSDKVTKKYFTLNHITGASFNIAPTQFTRVYSKNAEERRPMDADYSQLCGLVVDEIEQVTNKENEFLLMRKERESTRKPFTIYKGPSRLASLVEVKYNDEFEQSLLALEQSGVLPKLMSPDAIRKGICESENYAVIKQIAHELSQCDLDKALGLLSQIIDLEVDQKYKPLKSGSKDRKRKQQPSKSGLFSKNKKPKVTEGAEAQQPAVPESRKRKRKLSTASAEEIPPETKHHKQLP